eukprot:GFUD01001200.1.p1 GENE.GFUD01001200.1~~GFUD01001200.1.p1  ORF type:complete len:793 (+),score=149.52 GFUD01001200.1:191-2569(+)
MSVAGRESGFWLDRAMLWAILLFSLFLNISGTENINIEETTTTINGESKETTEQLESVHDSCCPSSGIPPAPRLIMLGQTGVGKSTLGKRLFGGKPGMCASPNSQLNMTHPVFGIGHSLESHTNDTAWIAGRWLGIETNPCVTILDTPGIGDTQGRDCEHVKQIAQFVRKIGDIHGFILLLKGSSNRFSEHLQEQLILLEETFGPSFWNNMIMEITWWKHRPSDIEDRLEDQKMDEKRKASEWNHQLAKEFSLAKEIQLVFVDPMFKEGKAKGNESEIFRRETSKLFDTVLNNTPYKCEANTCKQPGFTDGIPILVTEGPISERVGGKIALRWKIWFGSCGEQLGIRSYTIQFTDMLGSNITVFAMKDDQGKDSAIPKEETKRDGFPADAFVEDKCSKELLGKTGQCDNRLSKYKIVTLIFNILNEASFGSYWVRNTHGSSQQVEVRKVTDGMWGEWSDFGQCSRTCLSIVDNIWGAKVRTRQCTPQQNGGNDCQGDGKESIQCAHGPGDNGDVPRMCEGNFGKWSSWSPCTSSCGGGVKRRRRDCREVNCKEDDEGRTGNEDAQICNSDDCPVRSEYSPWSQWKCTQLCHKPYRKHLTREKRTRKCIPKLPKHEFRNCENMTDLTEESQSPCTSITQCPRLHKITTKVCTAQHSGTDDNVLLSFKNGVGDKCLTDWLDTSSNDWATGMTQTWTGDEKFLACSGDRFRPEEGLQVRFIMDTWGINFHSDELQLCKITAYYGTSTDIGASKWVWSKQSNKRSYVWNKVYKIWEAGHTRLFESYSIWLEMKKEY